MTDHQNPTERDHQGVRDFHEAYYHLDEAALRRVFTPTAQYTTVSEGTLVHYALEEFLPMALARPRPADDGTAYGYEVDSILFAGPSAAVVRVREEMFGYEYIELLSVVHLDGRWQVQSKVFHRTPIAQEV